MGRLEIGAPRMLKIIHLKVISKLKTKPGRTEKRSR
jgi:hypothetical protein